MEEKELKKIVDETFHKYGLSGRTSHDINDPAYEPILKAIAELQKQAEVFLAEIGKEEEK